MASVIDLHSGDLEAAGIPSDIAALLQHRNVGLFLFNELPSGTDPCRPSSENYDPRLGHF